MIAYKGFQKGLTCRGYQFKVGMNVTDKANCVAKWIPLCRKSSGLPHLLSKLGHIRVLAS